MPWKTMQYPYYLDVSFMGQAGPYAALWPGSLLTSESGLSYNFPPNTRQIPKTSPAPLPQAPTVPVLPYPIHNVATGAPFSLPSKLPANRWNYGKKIKRKKGKKKKR